MSTKIEITQVDLELPLEFGNEICGIVAIDSQIPEEFSCE